MTTHTQWRLSYSGHPKGNSLHSEYGSALEKPLLRELREEIRSLKK